MKLISTTISEETYEKLIKYLRKKGSTAKYPGISQYLRELVYLKMNEGEINGKI